MARLFVSHAAKDEALVEEFVELLQVGIGIMHDLTWSALWAGAGAGPAAASPRRKPLIVKPIFTYPLATRRPQTSWHNWGGVQTQADLKLAQAMPGFHWETIYGDYLREVGYALKKMPLQWERLT